MSTPPTTTDQSTTAADQNDTTPAPVHPCERCGASEARYVVADLEERDSSLFCGSCMVLTFAQVANDLIAASLDA